MSVNIETARGTVVVPKEIWDNLERKLKEKIQKMSPNNDEILWHILLKIKFPQYVTPKKFLQDVRKIMKKCGCYSMYMETESTSSSSKLAMFPIAMSAYLSRSLQYWTDDDKKLSADEKYNLHQKGYITHFYELVVFGVHPDILKQYLLDNRFDINFDLEDDKTIIQRLLEDNIDPVTGLYRYVPHIDTPRFLQKHGCLRMTDAVVVEMEKRIADYVNSRL